MKPARLAVLFTLLATFVGHAPAALALIPATSANAKSTSLNVTVTGGKDWVDTGMEVQTGDKLHITAKGTVNMGNNSGITPEGAARGWTDTLRALTVPSAGRGALVGRIGDSSAATPFFIGADGTVLAPIAGKLYLNINSDSMQTPSGKYDVHIDRTPSSTATSSGAAASQSKYDFKPLFAELDSKLPYRVTDQPEGGNPGDLVNFILVGNEDQVTNAFKAAGWIVADKTNTDAVVSALMATLQKNVYVAVPMSMLYLFGRSQDYGYERAEAGWSPHSAIISASGKQRSKRPRISRCGWVLALTISASRRISAPKMPSRTRSTRMSITSATSSVRHCSRPDRWRRCRT